jgi:hypothetical protein
MEEEQALQRKTQEEEARKSQWIQFTQSQIPEVAQRGSAVNKKFLALHQSYSHEMLPYLQACTAKYNAMMEAQQKKMANPTANPVPASDQSRKHRSSRAQATPNRSPKKVPLDNKMTDYDKQFVANLGLGKEGLEMYKKLKGIK